MKLVQQLPDRPRNSLTVAEEDRFDFDEALLPEDSWNCELEDDEFEAEKIVEVRSDRKTRFGRIHRQFKVYWKGYPDPSWVDEADLNCGAMLRDFERDRISQNKFRMMQSHEEEVERA